jgi:hypothetical protein
VGIAQYVSHGVVSTCFALGRETVSFFGACEESSLSLESLEQDASNEISGKLGFQQASYPGQILG